MRSSRKKTSKVWFVVTAAVALALLGVGGVFAYNQLRSGDNPQDPATQDGINYSPATDAEKQDSDRIKEIDEQRDDKPQTNTVNPVIVDASQYGQSIEVRSYVPNIVEDNGTCTTTFTKGQLTITKQTNASRDATTTRCGNLVVDRGEFQQSGQWTVTVSYASENYSGSSQPATLEVN